MKNIRPHKVTMLVVLDGWGIAIASQANAITRANTPFFDSLVARYPTITLQASGEATGLPWGEMGNSEVGHMSIGAGRIVFQELSRVNAHISSGAFFSRPAFLKAVEHAKTNNSTLHILGLASSGGVHSHIEHLFALLELAEKEQVKNTAIHIFLDGRDVSYASGAQFVKSIQEYCQGKKCAIASISGRFFAMDRDNHWDRIEKAYRAIADGACEKAFEDALAAVQDSYDRHVYDEEFAPISITHDGIPIGIVNDGDAAIFFNIRSDRARQLTRAFVDPEFNKFITKPYRNLCFVTFTEYEKGLPVEVAFEPQVIKNSLAEIISGAGKQQLHVAETEKYAHITYFLNDGREEPFQGEKRVMIPSPSVDSYDKKPEMSAHEIATTVMKGLESEEFDFIAVNFANADMVGHTGNMKAAMKGIETIDGCLKQIVTAALLKDGAIIITADHGNAESMIDLRTGAIDKEHSNNPVPCILIAHELEGTSLRNIDVSSKDLSILETSGILPDVAPTVLDFMGLQKPSDMTGNSLLDH